MLLGGLGAREATGGGAGLITGGRANSPSSTTSTVSTSSVTSPKLTRSLTSAALSSTIDASLGAATTLRLTGGAGGNLEPATTGAGGALGTVGSGRCGPPGRGGGGGAETGRPLPTRLGTAGAFDEERIGGGGGVSELGRRDRAAADGRGGRLARGAEAGGSEVGSSSSVRPLASSSAAAASKATSESTTSGASAALGTGCVTEACGALLEFSGLDEERPVLGLRGLESALAPVGRGTLGDFFAMRVESLTQSPGPRRGTNTTHQKTQL